MPAQSVVPVQPKLVQTQVPVPVASVAASAIGPKPILAPTPQVVQPLASVQPIRPVQPPAIQTNNLPQLAQTALPLNQAANRTYLAHGFGMNRPRAYNALSYRPNALMANTPGLNAVNGYNISSVNNLGSPGNMNTPGQYTTRTYNARRL